MAQQRLTAFKRPFTQKDEGDMSGTKEIKANCGYQANPTQPTCANCAAFASDMVVPAWALKPEREDALEKFESGEYAKEEKNLRCTVHGFATKKKATCNDWRSKQSGPSDGLVRVQVVTSHPERYLLVNKVDGTRWVIREGEWKSCPSGAEA